MDSNSGNQINKNEELALNNQMAWTGLEVI